MPMPRLLVTPILLAAATGSCAPTVQIPANDSTAPEIEMVVAIGGESATARSGGADTTLRVLSGRSVAVAASTTDDGGARHIAVEALSGGSINDGYGNLEREISKEGSASDPRRSLAVFGRLAPSGAAQQMRLRARGADFSGNTAVSPVATVEYLTPISLSLHTSASEIAPGEQITVSWNATGTNLDALTLRRPTQSGSWGTVTVPAQGSASIRIDRAGSYTLRLTATTQVEQRDGTTASAQISVVAPAPPTVSLSATPSSICPGGTVTLSWNAQHATGVEILPTGHVSSALSGSFSHQPAATTTYRAVATGSGSAQSPQRTVQVATPPATTTISKSGQLNAISTFTISDVDVQHACGHFNRVTGVRVHASLSNQESVGLEFTQGADRRTATLTATQPSTNVFNGLDPRGPWTIRVGNLHHSIAITVAP